MPDSARKAAIDTFGGCLLVIFATALGYLVLIACALVIARRPPWHVTLVDLVYWSAALSIPLAQQRVAIVYEASVGGHRTGSFALRMLAHLVVAAIGWVAVQSVGLL